MIVLVVMMWMFSLVAFGGALRCAWFAFTEGGRYDTWDYVAGSIGLALLACGFAAGAIAVARAYL